MEATGKTVATAVERCTCRGVDKAMRDDEVARMRVELRSRPAVAGRSLRWTSAAGV